MLSERRSNHTLTSAISHTDDAPVPMLVIVRRSFHEVVLDLTLILVRRLFLRPPLNTLILKDPAIVRNSCLPLLETVGEAVGLDPSCGSVKP